MHSMGLLQAPGPVELQAFTILVLTADFSDGAPCRHLCRLDLHHNMQGPAGMSAPCHAKILLPLRLNSMRSELILES